MSTVRSLTLFGLRDNELHEVDAERADRRGVEPDEQADGLQLRPVPAPVRPDVEAFGRVRHFACGPKCVLEVVGEAR